MPKTYACEVRYHYRLAPGPDGSREVQVSADSPQEAADVARRMFDVSDFEAEVVRVVETAAHGMPLHSFGGAIGTDSETPAFCETCGAPLTAAHALTARRRPRGGR